MQISYNAYNFINKRMRFLHLREKSMSQPQYKASIVRQGENIAIEVIVPAWDPFMAQRTIESIYGPVRSWITVPQEIK